MGPVRGAWALSGVLAGFAGLGLSRAAATWLTIRDDPFVAVADLAVRLTPGPVVEAALSSLGSAGKSVLVAVMLALLLIVFACVGAASRRHWWRSVLVLGLLAGIGALGVLTQRGAQPIDLAPVALGLIVWVLSLLLLTSLLRAAETPAPAESAVPAESAITAEPGASGEVGESRRHRPLRRAFLLRAAVVVVAGLAGEVTARLFGRGRQQVQETRALLRLPVTPAEVPELVRVAEGPEGITAWRTANTDFYRIHTALVEPTIDAAEWRLRIHGMVERELVLSFADLLDREVTEAWVTLSCVSGEVGGDLVGNAWWSGVRVADLLAEAGVRPGADAVLQTSQDGWNCGTPLETLTDGRDALLAFAMNGEPLPLDHGYPVRTVVPGLYGYVSACKWVVDLEVTRFADISAYWTERGWAERGPVKLASRIDVPAPGATVPAGYLRVGGVAWMQHTGIAAVEVQLDGGDWTRAEVGGAPSVDTWVQWALDLSVSPGEHLLRVRAIDREGEVQTGIRRDVLPDGATGWHEVSFTAEEAG